MAARINGDSFYSSSRAVSAFGVLQKFQESARNLRRPGVINLDNTNLGDKMKNQLLTVTFTCLCLVAAIPTGLIAQIDNAKNPAVKISDSFNARVSQQENDSIADPTVFTIDFPGGTIAEYVEILRKAPNFDNEMNREPVNIVVATSAQDFFLPPIKVTTNMTGAMGLLEGCSDESSQVVVDHDPSGNIQLVRVDSEERTMVTVINAKALLEKTAVDELMDVIDVGLAMQGTTSKVELKLHEGTGLLFAKGTPSGTHLVQQIIEELSGNQRNVADYRYGPASPGSKGLGLGGALGLEQPVDEPPANKRSGLPGSKSGGR